MNILKFLANVAGVYKDLYGKAEKVLKSPKLMRRIFALNKAHRDKIIKIKLLVENVTRDVTSIVSEVIVLAGSEEGKAIVDEFIKIGEGFDESMTDLAQEAGTIFDRFLGNEDEEKDEGIKA